jgi:tetratricopeptide (TPR) repeat protein
LKPIFDHALQLAKSGELDEAWELLALNPSSLNLRELHLMLDIALLSKDLVRQEKALLCLIKIQADNYQWVNQLATLYYNQQLFPKAASTLKEYLLKVPENASAWFNFAYMSKLSGEYLAAITTYERAIALGVDGAEEAYCNIGNIYSQELLDVDNAKQNYRKALECDANYIQAEFNLAGLLEREGKLQEASSAFLNCAKHQEFRLRSLSRALELSSQAEVQEVVAQDIEACLSERQQSRELIDLVDALFSLGRYYESICEFDKSWACFVRANKLDNSQRAPSMIKKSLLQCDLIKQQFDINKLVKGDNSELVFICGLFRSGSTLLETMLSTHPSLVSGGEIDVFRKLLFSENEFFAAPKNIDNESASNIIKQYLSRIDTQLIDFRTHNASIGKGKNALRILDKQPENFMLIGHIKKLFPKAKFIWTLREKENSVFSIFTQHFGFYQPYSSSLADIRLFYEQHLELLTFWKSFFTDDIKIVNYESLVSEPEQTMSEIFDFLAVSKDTQFMNFHESRHLVSTASMAQIRKPLHKNSLNRVDPYRKWLDN